MVALYTTKSTADQRTGADSVQSTTGS